MQVIPLTIPIPPTCHQKIRRAAGMESVLTLIAPTHTKRRGNTRESISTALAGSVVVQQALMLTGSNSLKITKTHTMHTPTTPTTPTVGKWIVALMWAPICEYFYI
jgi:hypothetical protein